MQNKYKIKIVHSEYISKSDLIRWDVIFLDDNTEQSYVWPSVDLLLSLGITNKVTKEQIVQFCADMLGKTVNFVIDKNVQPPDFAINKDDYKKLNDELANHFSNFKKYTDGE